MMVSDFSHVASLYQCRGGAFLTSFSHCWARTIGFRWGLDRLLRFALHSFLTSGKVKTPLKVLSFNPIGEPSLSKA